MERFAAWHLKKMPKIKRGRKADEKHVKKLRKLRLRFESLRW